MKLNIPTLAAACLSLLAISQPAKASNKSSSLSPKTVICQAEVEEQTVFHGPRTVTRYGFCEKDGMGRPSRWFMPPIFQELKADPDNRLVSGVKFNSPKDADPSSYQRYGWISSVVFNADGSQRFEVSGRIGTYERGLADVLTGQEPSVLGITYGDMLLKQTSRQVAFALSAADFFIGYVADFVGTTLMLSGHLYLNGERRVDQSMRVGFVDTQGKFIIPQQYLQHWNANFHERYAVMGTPEHKVGLMNTAGQWVLEPTFDAIDAWPMKGRNVWTTVKRDCGWLKCRVNVAYLDKTTLKQVDAWDKSEFRWKLLNVLKSDSQRLGSDSDGLVRLMVSSIAAGTLLLWPVMIWRQRRRKASWRMATLKGLGWAAVWASVAVVGSIILVIVGVLFMLSLGGGGGAATGSGSGGGYGGGSDNNSRSPFDTNVYDRNGNIIQPGDTHHPDYYSNYGSKGSPYI